MHYLSPRSMKALAVAKQHADSNRKMNDSGDENIHPSDIFAALLDEDNFCLIFSTSKADLLKMKTSYLKYVGRSTDHAMSKSREHELLSENQRLKADLERAIIKLNNIEAISRGERSATG